MSVAWVIGILVLGFFMAIAGAIIDSGSSSTNNEPDKTEKETNPTDPESREPREVLEPEPTSGDPLDGLEDPFGQNEPSRRERELERQNELLKQKLSNLERDQQEMRRLLEQAIERREQTGSSLSNEPWDEDGRIDDIIDDIEEPKI